MLPKKVSFLNSARELSLLLSIWSFLTPLWSLGNPHPSENPEEIESIFIAAPRLEKSTVRQDSSSENETTTVFFDLTESNLDENNQKPARVSYQELMSQSETLRSREYIDLNAFRVQIPVSIENLDDFSDVKEMSDELRGVFIFKKQKWLTRFAKSLSFFRLHPAKINAVLNHINRQMYMSAIPIARANGFRFTPTVAVSIGIGLPEWFSVWLKSVLLKSNLLAQRTGLKGMSTNWGFYWFFSLGFTFVIAKYDGKRNWSARPILQIRRATSTFSPFAMLTAGFPTGLGYVNHNAPPAAYENFDFVKASFPTFIKGPREFFMNLPFGLSFVPVPMAGTFAGIIGEVHQFSLHPRRLPELAGLVKQYFASRKMRCNYVFR